MAMLNGSIVLISLPDIFKGIGINPLEPQEINYLLWTLMGYLVVSATLLVAFGRISDIFGRARLYNLGFAIFAVGSILLVFVQGSGNTAAIQIISFRLVQAVGGAFLFANSTAILTDAFPPDQRGMAMGINQIAALAGQFLGLILGGILAALNWRAVFLVSVPFAIGGTLWAYYALHEISPIKKDQHLDIPGNIFFAVGLTMILVGMTYGLQPYGSSNMGWASPLVLICLLGGIALLAIFIFVERVVPEPMFRLDLFKIRMFTAGNIAGFVSSLARGGLNFMLIIWLQGIWLPLHGYSFEQTPLWAGIYMLPITAGFLLMGPLSGYLSDRYGARFFSTGGMMVTAAGFVGLMLLPVNFYYTTFGLILLIIGCGMGMFAAPNTTAIMNAVPQQHRGASSGMRATFQNTASTLSITLIFTIVIIGLSGSMPSVLYQGLSNAGVPAHDANQISNLPPTSALFAAFLGYNPIKTILPPQILQSIPPQEQSRLVSTSFFPTLISGPFQVGLHLAFIISAGLSLIAALASLLRGKRYIPELENETRSMGGNLERNKRPIK